MALLGTRFHQPVQGARHLGRFGGHLVGVNQCDIPVAALEARQDVGVDQGFIGDAIELGQPATSSSPTSLQRNARRYVIGHFAARGLDTIPQRGDLEARVARSHRATQHEVGNPPFQWVGLFAAGCDQTFEYRAAKRSESSASVTIFRSRASPEPSPGLVPFRVPRGEAGLQGRCHLGPMGL